MDNAIYFIDRKHANKHGLNNLRQCVFVNDIDSKAEQWYGKLSMGSRPFMLNTIQPSRVAFLVKPKNAYPSFLEQPESLKELHQSLMHIVFMAKTSKRAD